MKKNYKKYLIASFSLGLTTIAVGSIAASCATTSSSTNNSDPSNGNGSDTSTPSESGLVTTPGQPLTQEQMDYESKLASDIQTQYEANVKLNYSVPEDKANIDDQISKYDAELSKGELGNLATKYNEMSNPPAGSSPTTSAEEVNSLLSTFYDNFKQKNLIPTQDEITKYSELPADGSVSWKVVSGYYSVFYSNPKAIILLFQTVSIAASNEADKFDINQVNSWDLANASFQNTNKIFNDIKETNPTEKSPAYQALEYFSNFFIPKKN